MFFSHDTDIFTPKNLKNTKNKKHNFKKKTGTLEAGSPTCRLEGKIEITLHGEYGSTAVSDRPSLLGAAADDWHIKAIVVAGGNESKLEL